MTITWIAPDAKVAVANFLCGMCLSRINRDDDFYMAKSGRETVRLCEDCTASTEVEKELVASDDHEDWLGELF